MNEAIGRRDAPSPCGTLLAAAVICVALLASGCGADRSGGARDTGANGPGREQHPVDSLAAACPGRGLSGAGCVDIFISVCRLGDERCRPVILERAGEACADPAADACTAAADALVAMADGEALRVALALTAVPPAAGVLRFDDALLATTMSELCGVPSPQADCERLAGILAEKGVEVAREWRQREEVRALLLDGARRGGNRSDTLAKLQARGEAAVPQLLGLIGEARLSAAEEELAMDAIRAFGAAGARQMVDVMKHGDLNQSLAAASIGWDRNAYEREDERRAADEEAVRTVYLDEAGDHVGRNVRIELTDGSEREGLLTKVDDTHLYLQLSIGAGSVGYTVRRTDVAKIRF